MKILIKSENKSYELSIGKYTSIISRDSSTSLNIINSLNSYFNEKRSDIDIINLETGDRLEKTNLKLANMTINGVYCSSYIFLLSHILFKLVLYGKSDYIKYSNLICILSNIASKHSYHSIFKPSHFSSKYTAGNKKSIYKSNDSIIDSITKSSEPKKSKDYKIVINYETS